MKEKGFKMSSIKIKFDDRKFKREWRNRPTVKR